MGGSQAKGSVHVSVDRTDYNPGDEVSGIVYLYLKQRIRTDVIWLKFKCVEQCQWRATRRSVSHRGVNHLVRQKFPLWKWTESEIPPGSYSFPFTVSLPVNLPGTFKLSSRLMSASVAYKIKAEVNGKKTHLTHHVDLRVRQHLDPPLNQPASERIAQLSSCLCMKKGQVSLKVYFEKPIYYTDEPLKIFLEIDNSKSRMELWRISATLYRILRLRSSRGQIQVFKTEIKTLRQPQRIPAHQSLLNEQAVVLLMQTEEFRESLNDTASTKGQLIECVYVVEVEATPSTAYCCASVIPSVSATVVIWPGKMIPLPLPSAPADWHPQLMEPTTWQPNPQFEYQPSAPQMDPDELKVVSKK